MRDICVTARVPSSKPHGSSRLLAEGLGSRSVLPGNARVWRSHIALFLQSAAATTRV